MKLQGLYSMTLEAFHGTKESKSDLRDISQGQTDSEKAKSEFWQGFKTVMALQSHAPALIPSSCREHQPLSFSQERLWLLDQVEPDRSSAYNIPLVFCITGLLNVSALEMSLNEIQQRHENLRTNFLTVDNKPVQVIRFNQSLQVARIDLRKSPLNHREAEAKQVIIDEIKQPFDLSQGLLWRATLLQLECNEHMLLVTVHHIVMDAWSKGVLFEELAVLYDAFCTGKTFSLPNLPVQYADFAIWQRNCLQGEYSKALFDYWKRQLNGNLCELQIPTDRSRPIPQTRLSRCHELSLPLELTAAVKELSRSAGTTLFATYLATFKVLLHHYTDQDNLFVCSPIANRNQKDIKGLIGYFVNLLILRTDLSGDPSFRVLLGRVRKVATEGYAHQDMPVQLLINSLGLLRVPISQVMFAFQNTPIHNLKLPGLEVQTLNVDVGTADFDLYLYLIENAGILTAVLKYNADLFDDVTANWVLNHFQVVLENIVADPDQPISLLLPLTEDEQRSLEDKRQRQSELKNARKYQINFQKDGVCIAPQSPLEIKLVEIWRQVLGLEQISIRDNFFELGGGSLLAISLLSNIENTFGKSLPLSTLIHAPTIEQFAIILNQEEESKKFSSLVPIQTLGIKPPFFCVHGQQGNVLNFWKLAQRLGTDQPFYGLRAKGLEDGEQPCYRIEDMAVRYISEIQSLQPNGPYFLGGNSMGGTVALEMAQQLRKRGYQVALLVMFDTFGLNSFPRLTFRRQQYLRYLSRLGISQLFLNEIKSIALRMFRKRVYKFYSFLNIPLPAEFRRELVAEANMQAKQSYEASSYTGEINLFRAEHPFLFSNLNLPTIEDWHSKDPLHNWGTIADGGLNVIDVPGDHFSMFDDPHVLVLADKLRICLEVAQSINVS
jgi:thioesterase domain-containing protein/acyl carrier protein